MPDPFGIPTKRDPLRPVVRKFSAPVLAIFAILALLVLGGVFWKFHASDQRTAINPETTVGSRTSADPPPLAPPAPKSDPASPKPIQ
jgi:hypothetical protein